jgi:predicted ATP-grasp superfamily ATP-dependent carboligase
MARLGTAIGEKPVLIAASDLFVSAIGRFAAELQPYYRFSESGARLQATLATKEKQYALASKYDLPCPRSAYIQSVADLEQFCEAARFPALLKPRHQREWNALPPNHPFRALKTISAQSSAELLRHYSEVAGLVPEAVVQEEIVGPDSAKYCYLAVYGQSGHRLGACVVQELRAYPLLYGCATMVKPVIDDEIDQVCDKFLLSIGYIGLCEIELKRDSRDGKLLLIEVNPRFSGTGDSAKYAGVETGYVHYLDLIGRTPAPIGPSRFDFSHVMFAADLAAFPDYHSQGVLTWTEWIRSLRGTVKYFDFDLHDFSNARRTAQAGILSLISGLCKRRH